VDPCHLGERAILDRPHWEAKTRASAAAVAGNGDKPIAAVQLDGHASDLTRPTVCLVQHAEHVETGVHRRDLDVSGSHDRGEDLSETAVSGGADTPPKPLARAVLRRFVADGNRAGCSAGGRLGHNQVVRRAVQDVT
jgi:hypothetical protein